MAVTFNHLQTKIRLETKVIRFEGVLAIGKSWSKG
jgi:hypothetical protein